MPASFTTGIYITVSPAVSPAVSPFRHAALAEAGDIERVSRAINGTNGSTGRANGIDERIAFYHRALAAGDELLELAPVRAPLRAGTPSREV